MTTPFNQREADATMAKISLKKLYERRRREADEPIWEAEAKAGDALVNKLERMRIAYNRDGLEGVQRLLHKREAQRQRRPAKDLPPPEMPAFNFGPRKSLYELRPSALCLIGEYGFVTEP
jgi:hypothetical protein